MNEFRNMLTPYAIMTLPLFIFGYLIGRIFSYRVLAIISLIFSIITFLVVGILLNLQYFDSPRHIYTQQEIIKDIIMEFISIIYILLILHLGGYLGLYFKNKPRK